MKTLAYLIITLTALLSMSCTNNPLSDNSSNNENKPTVTDTISYDEFSKPELIVKTSIRSADWTVVGGTVLDTFKILSNDDEFNLFTVRRNSGQSSNTDIKYTVKIPKEELLDNSKLAYNFKAKSDGNELRFHDNFRVQYYSENPATGNAKELFDKTVGLNSNNNYMRTNNDSNYVSVIGSAPFAYDSENNVSMNNMSSDLGDLSFNKEDLEDAIYVTFTFKVTDITKSGGELTISTTGITLY